MMPTLHKRSFSEIHLGAASKPADAIEVVDVDQDSNQEQDENRAVNQREGFTDLKLDRGLVNGDSDQSKKQGKWKSLVSSRFLNDLVVKQRYHRLGNQHPSRSVFPRKRAGMSSTRLIRKGLPQEITITFTCRSTVSLISS